MTISNEEILSRIEALEQQIRGILGVQLTIIKTSVVDMDSLNTLSDTVKSLMDSVRIIAKSS
jgi:hypothetical protein